MANFTFTAEASPTAYSTTQTGNVGITVSPTDIPLVITKMKPGDSASKTIAVSNTGDLNIYYFVSGDWKENGATTARMATILTNRLYVSVVASPEAPTPTTLFNGLLKDFVDRPDEPGRELLEEGHESVEFTFTLPENASNIVQDIDIRTDFVFVAVQQ